jgi:starch phosphorylase
VDANGKYHVQWIPGAVVRGMAYDTPILGYKVKSASMLRLWKAEAPESFDFQDFNRGDYYGAVEEKVVAENLTKVLYPNDEPLAGKRLRLEQQYFFVSCSLQNLIQMHLLREPNLDNFHEVFAAQLNDTHPSIAVAELMRLLVDEHCMTWERAWDITCKSLAYTNHTLLPEALEKWALPFFRNLLPRHLEIVYEINRRFLDYVRTRFPNDEGIVSRLSIIEEGGEKHVRMAHLASVGSHRINGVAALHTQLLSRTVLKDFYELYPERFVNVTNGVTPRRWIALSNPDLTRLLSSAIGDRWICHFEDEIKHIEPFADDPDFRKKWREVKQTNKIAVAKLISDRTGSWLIRNRFLTFR